MVTSISKFAKPFAIMKIGIEGYGGEEDLWNDTNLTVCHIMVRVTEELKRAKANRRIDFYPFGLTAGAVSSLESLKEMHPGPVDLYFVAVQTDIEDWKSGFPDSKNLKWDKDNQAYKHLVVGDRTIDIPHPIRLWAGEGQDYPALLVDSIQYFEYPKRIQLDFDKTTCVHINSKTPIKDSLSGQLTFGVFSESGDQSKSNRGFALGAMAKARLVPPYYGIAKP